MASFIVRMERLSLVTHGRWSIGIVIDWEKVYLEKSIARAFALLLFLRRTMEFTGMDDSICVTCGQVVLAYPLGEGTSEDYPSLTSDSDSALVIFATDSVFTDSAFQNLHNTSDSIPQRLLHTHAQCLSNMLLSTLSISIPAFHPQHVLRSSCSRND